MKRIKPPSRLATVVLAAFLVVAGITLYFTFTTVRELVTSWNISGLGPGSFTPSNQPDSTNSGNQPAKGNSNANAPLQPVGGPTPQPWDGASRVTILIMGLDFRDWEAGNGPPRTDTMILLTIDPLTKSAGMLSIPRDMWVSIPGFDYGKINTAYQLGEAYQLPGGGPGLAVATVEQFIGVPINFYAQIDFGAFERFIDEIDGLKIEIKEPIKLDPIGPKLPRVIEPGVTVLPGDLALAYARTRSTEGGDFDRAQRQQQVILAIRDRILDFNMAPTLIARAPVLYQELSSGITTNMSLNQVIQLGLLGLQIDREDIRHGVIGPEYVTFGTSPDGLDILKPLPDKIRLLRDEIFVSSNQVSPVVQNKTPEELMKEEGAQVAVLNGTYTAGLAASTTEYLQSLGVNVIITDNSTELFNTTTIIDYTGNPYTLQFLVDLMNITPNRIFHSYDPNSEVDLEIDLGDDWAASGVLP